jgi:hypothetical protein
MFVNSSTGWAAGELIMYGGWFSIVKTSNGGLNWNVQFTNHGLYSIYFPNINTGWTVGDGGKILSTTNAGANWITESSGTSNNLWSVYFANFLTGWTVGANGTILKTTDGGGLFTNIKSDGNEIPLSFSLSQNYPNPFNPVTKITYSLPEPSQGGAVQVRLIIYDILGREIETLVNENKKPGNYEMDWDGSRFASGVYFYRLVTDDWIETKKMMLVK